MTKTITAFLSPAIKIGLTLALVGALFFPMFSYAATYEYINTSGNLSSTTASSSSDAIANAPNIHANSGVMLVGGTGGSLVSANFTTNGLTEYGYVNSSGVVTFVTSDTSAEAFRDSINISKFSGVIMINSQADEDLEGDNTTL